MLPLAGFYEQCISIFFPLRFNSTISFNSLSKETIGNLTGISSCIWNHTFKASLGEGVDVLILKHFWMGEEGAHSVCDVPIKRNVKPSFFVI